MNGLSLASLLNAAEVACYSLLAATAIFESAVP